MSVDRRWAAVGIMAMVFASGAVTGGVLARTFLDDDRPAVTRDRDRDRPDRRGDRGGPDRRPSRPGDPRALMSSRAVEHLADRLDLDAEQRVAVSSVLDRQRERASAVFDDVGPRLRAVLDSTNVQIRALLTPEQQAEFDEIVREDRGVLGRRYVPPDSARSR